MANIDQILEELVTGCGGVIDNPIDHKEMRILAEAKTAIKEYFMGIVGEDEDDMVSNIDDACSIQDRNALRNEIRTRLEKE